MRAGSILIALSLAGPAMGQKPATAPATQPAASTTFTISAETTREVGPLRADGTVDYTAALNARMTEGVTPDKNATVALMRVLGPRAYRYEPGALKQLWPAIGIEPLADDNAAYFVPADRFVSAGNPRVDLEKQIDATRNGPWTAEQYPQLGEWLRTQDAAITRIADATKLPRLYLPLISASTEPPNMYSAVAAGAALTAHRQAATALGQRAMFRLANGDLDGFRADRDAIIRLARLVAQRPLYIDQLVAVGIDSLATAAITNAATSERLTPAQAKQLRADLEAQPTLPSVAHAFDLGERYVMLDFVGLAAKHGWARAQQMFAGAGGKQRMLFAGKQNRDWDDVLRKTNGRYDRMIAVLNAKTPEERRAAERAIDEDDQALNRSLNHPLGALAPPEDRFYRLLSPTIYAARKLPLRTAVGRDMARVALALAAYRSERGGYPKTLAELVPAYADALPTDVYARGDNVKFLYELNGRGGYRLASVGDDGKDERDPAAALPSGYRPEDIVVTGGPQPEPPKSPDGEFDPDAAPEGEIDNANGKPE